MRAVIERYDAFVEKFVGDAVMAVLGAPVAHEDDPHRPSRPVLVDPMAGMAAKAPRFESQRVSRSQSQSRSRSRLCRFQ